MTSKCIKKCQTNDIKNPRALFYFCIEDIGTVYLIFSHLDSCIASSMNRLACMIIDWLCAKTEPTLLYLVLKISTELTYLSSLRTSNRHCKKLCPLSLIPSMVSLNTSMARWSILSSHSSWLRLPWPVTANIDWVARKHLRKSSLSSMQWPPFDCGEVADEENFQ